MNEVKIFRECEDAIFPTVAYGNSACFDVYAIEDVVIPSKSFAYVPNGIRIVVPEKYYARFNTRSSMGYKKHLLVYPGVIDASYSGDLTIKVYNMSNESYTIKKGEKYAQIEILKIPEYTLKEITLQEYNKLQDSLIRGDKKCWGSSGK